MPFYYHTGSLFSNITTHYLGLWRQNGKLLFHFAGISTFSNNLNRIGAYLFAALGIFQNIVFLLFQDVALIGDAYLRALDFLIVGEFGG